MCVFIYKDCQLWFHFFFRKFYAMMETGKRVRTKGLSRCLVGAGTWLMPGKPAKAVEKAQADESCLLRFTADWKGPKKVPVGAGTRQVPTARGSCRLAKRHLGAGVGASEPPAIPQPPVFAGGLLLLCITCPVPLPSSSWLYSWRVVTENPILKVKNRSQMRRWSVCFNMGTHVTLTSSLVVLIADVELHIKIQASVMTDMRNQ